MVFVETLCFVIVLNGRKYFTVAVIVSFLEQFGSMVFPDKPPVMTDLMDWISNTDESEFHS